MNSSLKRITVLREEKWLEVRLAEVKKNERFRIDDGTFTTEYTAASDGYWCDMNSQRSLQAEADRINSGILVEEAK